MKPTLTLREKALQLRTHENLSYGEIRKRLGVPKSTLSYWLRDYPLSEQRIAELRRKGWKKGEASRERFRNTMRKKLEQQKRAIYKLESRKMRKLSNSTIYIAGLMLYLGEGEKKSNYRISLSNTDPNLICFFISWLCKFFDVSREEIRIQLHLYENMNVEKEQEFWQNTLSLKKSQFYKTQVRSLKKNSFSYVESFRHGTCQVFYSSGRRKMRMMMSIKAFLDSYSEM